MLVESDKDLFRMLSLVGFEVAVVVGVHLVGRSPSIGVGWSDPVGWLAVSSVDQVLVSMVWLAVAALAWWTLGSTLLYLAARLWGLRRALRIAERLVAPAVRRTVDRALAAALAGTVLLGPAAPALANEPDAFGALTGEPPASEYEPQPAGSEQPPVTTPAPQRKAPKPVEQHPSDDEEPAESDQREGGEEEPEQSDTPEDEKKPGKKKDKKSGKKAGSGAATRSGDSAAEPPTEEDTGMETDAAQAAADAANRAAAEAMTASEEADGDPASEQAGEAQPVDAREQSADDEGDESGDSAGQSQATQDGSDASAADDEQPSRPRPGHRYTVRVGDHLWKIAREVVSGGDETADRSAVAAYWAALVREATPRLRSGNPNLIYPGEKIALPPLSEGEREAR